MIVSLSGWLSSDNTLEAFIMKSSRFSSEESDCDSDCDSDSDSDSDSDEDIIILY